MNVAVLEGRPGQWAINNSLKNVTFNLVQNIMDPNNQRGHFNGYFLKRGRNYVAMNNKGDVVGFAILGPNKKGRVDVLLIGAKPGRGIGTKIMNQIYTNARERQVRKIRAKNTVNAAKKFYRSVGFKEKKKHTMTRRVSPNTRKSPSRQSPVQPSSS